MFETQTPETIKARILAEIDRSQGLSPMAGGFADGVVGPVAEEMSKVYMALSSVPSMLFVDEASGGYIDLVGEQYCNITRRPGTRAYCDMNFTGESGLVIPQGTAFLTPGGLSFTLTAPVTVGTGGVATGRLAAAQAGSVYNVEAGTIDRMYVNLAGLTRFENEAAHGGTDAEDDAALLARIRERVRRPPTSGNGYQYRQWALEVAGVGHAKVVELPAGPGTVGITLVDSNYEAPAPEIVSEVAEHIEAERPIGPTVTVQAATALEISVEGAVTLTQGGSLVEVQAAFRSALEGYLRELVDEKFTPVYYKAAEDKPYTILYNRVLALLLNTKGVENFSTLTVNGKTEDLAVPAESIPILKKVVVT